MTAEELKARRTALGLSQVQLAAALGVSRRNIENWESLPTTPNNRRIPPLLEAAIARLEEQRARHEAPSSKE